jgi:hypothetical protein
MAAVNSSRADRNAAGLALCNQAGTADKKFLDYDGPN